MNARPHPFIAPQPLLDETGVQGVYVLTKRSGPAFLDAMCAGARPTMPTPRIDWSKSKEENMAAALADPFAMFAPKRGLIDFEDGEASCASYEVTP